MGIFLLQGNQNIDDLLKTVQTFCLHIYNPRFKLMQ